MTPREHPLPWILLLAGALGLGAWSVVRRAEGPRVDAVSPVRRPLVQTIVTSGRVISRRQSELGAMVAGTVAEVRVEEGDRVEAGELLVRLADEDALANLAEAEAMVSEAEARLSRVQGVGRKMAMQALRQATIEAELAETEFRRQEKLVGSGAVSELSFERARRDRDRARSRRVSAWLEVAAAAPKGSDVAIAAASLRRAQARLTAAQVALEHRRIRAPMRGVVLRRRVEPAEVVRPGDPLVTFAGEGPLQVRVEPDESNLALLRKGQRALVSPEAFPDKELEAEVSRIAPSVDPARGTVEVDLDLAVESDLRPDMTVTAEIEVGRTASALVVPSWLIRELGSDAPWVLVVEEGAARRRPVDLGLEGDDLIEVISGLGEEDRIVSPTTPVEQGDPVRIRHVRPAVPPDEKGDA